MIPMILKHYGDKIKRKLFGYEEEGGIGWKLKALPAQIRSLEGKLKFEKMTPEEEQRVRKQLQNLQKEYADLKSWVASHPLAQRADNYDKEPVFHKGLAQDLQDKVEDHPVATGLGVLAAGAGALAARKLWKRRQQKKQMMQR